MSEENCKPGGSHQQNHQSVRAVIAQSGQRVAPEGRPPRELRHSGGEEG